MRQRELELRTDEINKILRSFIEPTSNFNLSPEKKEEVRGQIQPDDNVPEVPNMGPPEPQRTTEESSSSQK